jgi:hypothetical protein
MREAVEGGGAGPQGSLVDRLAARWRNHLDMPTWSDADIARFFLLAIADVLGEESRRVIGPPADTEDAVFRTEKSYGYFAAANFLRTAAIPEGEER